MEKQIELQNKVFKQKYWFSIAPEVQASAASTAASSPRMSLEEVCRRRCRKKSSPGDTEAGGGLWGQGSENVQYHNR